MEVIMSKNSSKALNWIAGGIAAYFVGSAIAGAIKRKNATSGIGAAKRRIYKEISLAQQAGVDFTKKYEDLTDDEILALQRVSNDTGFTETYYKGLKKAYDAISGIGEAYDVADENGNTVLTWIEDPELHAAQNREIEEARQRTLEAEARAEKARKSKRATERRLQQMSLFGIGDATYTKQQLNTYLDTYNVLDLVAQYVSKNKVLCEIGDISGGRSFYLSRNNFLYLFNYCLMRGIPIAVYTGDHWLTRNNGDDLISGCGYTQDVENELWEIWREQLEYGDTDYDYETWRAIYGDAYVPYI